MEQITGKLVAVTATALLEHPTPLSHKRPPWVPLAALLPPLIRIYLSTLSAMHQHRRNHQQHTDIIHSLL
jgi:hypothetical protein